MSASGGVEREALISQVALFRHLPALAGVIPWARLGDWPTPIEAAPELDSALGAAPGRDPIYIKREDRSSAVYGGNKVRFLTPVRSGSRVRGRFTLLAFDEKRPGQFQQTTNFVVEIEGQDKPALIAEWISQIFV